ncbi:MAG TPA: hypothetical protein PLN21_09755 [Gemmatales bacterium]|nr:hypothetical protein [Gemmatales bacterium]
MEQYKSVLEEIHTYLLRIRSVSEELDEGPRQLKRLQSRVASTEKALADHHTKIKSMKVSINDKEVSLKANADQIKKYKKDLNAITSKKEFDALNIEIAGLEKRNGDLEDEGLQLMTEVEEAVARISTLEQAIKEAKANYARVDAELKAQLPSWQTRLDEAKQQFAIKKMLIPEDWRKIFDRQELSEGADALAPLSGRSCSACYTDVTAQQVAMITTGKIEACKSCGKLLYQQS